MENLKSLLSNYIETFKQNGADVSFIEMIETFRENLADQDLKIGIYGHFSSGKSTFINALLNEPRLLPSDFEPTTAIMTEIRHGKSLTIDLYDRNGNRVRRHENLDVDAANLILKNHSTEIGNCSDKNTNPVDRLVIYHPSTFISQELVFLDTPGINSMIKEHYQRTIRIMLQSDGFIFVMDADSGLKRVEKHLFDERVKENKWILIILNKIDLKNYDNNQLDEMIQDISRNIGVPAENIIPVSALDAVEGILENDQATIRKSRIDFCSGIIRKYVKKNDPQKIKSSRIANHICHKVAQYKNDLNNEIAIAMDNIERDEKELRKRIKTLELNKDELKKDLLELYRSALTELHRKYNENSDQIKAQIDKIHNKIDNCSEEDEIRRVLKEFVPYCKGKIKGYNSECKNILFTFVENSELKCNDYFNKGFENIRFNQENDPFFEWHSDFDDSTIIFDTIIGLLNIASLASIFFAGGLGLAVRVALPIATGGVSGGYGGYFRRRLKLKYVKSSAKKAVTEIVDLTIIKTQENSTTLLLILNKYDSELNHLRLRLYKKIDGILEETKKELEVKERNTYDEGKIQNKKLLLESLERFLKEVEIYMREP